jgi:hypothetical protein
MSNPVNSVVGYIRAKKVQAILAKLEISLFRVLGKKVSTIAVRQSAAQLPFHQKCLMVVRAIPLSVCRLGPPSDDETRNKNGLNVHTVYSVNICRQS